MVTGIAFCIHYTKAVLIGVLQQALLKAYEETANEEE